MRLFSSRRESITADLRERAARFEQRYARKPSQRELAQLAQASNFATRAAKGGALDFAQLHQGWADKLARTLGVPLAQVAPSVWHAGAPDSGASVLSELDLGRAAQKAVALAQREKSTWTRADLIKYLGRVLPRSGMESGAAAALLENLADRTLRSEFEPVLCLEAPEAVEAPPGLLRADGRSIYQRHGGVRYATRAQLAMEERMLAQARGGAAPSLSRAAAARALGADPERLEHALAGSAPGAPDARTQSGLRKDQAAAALSVLTDGRRVSVIDAPAGSGKTRILTELARAWESAGLGRVVGITPSQSARNTLAAGVAESYNTAQFLGHLPGQRGARGPVSITPGSLLSVDEASMVSGPDLADLISLAEENGAKVILAGDTGQLQAVENGGGMALLASELGYVQLAEPVRFRVGWEQAASLRLRAGDTSVLADYDQHARIRGGEPEQILDAAAAAYVALTVDGTDTLLMAADHALRRELSRRIRDELIHLGVIQPGPAVRIADGTEASPGDLIVCTRNDHAVEAGEPGRALANGDLLRIEAVTEDGLLVRRALDADPATGQRRWTDCHFLYANYEDAELGYAVTNHTAQGRTVHTGLAVITGTEDRQHAYVALTRGTDTNTAYVFTVSPKLADPAPGPRPAPELARYDKIATAQAAEPSQAAEPAGARDALGVLADVLQRDGQQLSASQTWQQALADADHLAILHAIWTAETTPAREQRYQDLLLERLPPGYRQELGHQAKWLWRTLRAAELAGLDPGQAIADAIAERDLAGARDIPSVIDARLRHRTGALLPRPAGPWAAQLPDIPDLGRRAYTAQIAAAMDARKDRIGDHAADNSLPWAVRALGPVPAHPVDQLDWQRKAASIGAYRELSGYDHPADPIGPEPTAAAPDIRAAWYEALAALGPADGPDIRGMPDGTLLHLRDTYPIETTWAPQWVGDGLRQVRTGAAEARLAAIRAGAEAETAESHGEHEKASQQQALSASYQAMHDAYAEREAVFAAVMADRQSLMTPAEDPDYEDLGPAFPAWTGADRDAILQPPQPQIQPVATDPGTRDGP
jgi:AAA domain